MKVKGFVESINFEVVYSEAPNKLRATINFASRMGRAAKTTAALRGSRKAKRQTGRTHPENKTPGPESGLISSTVQYPPGSS